MNACRSCNINMGNGKGTEEKKKEKQFVKKKE